MARISIHIVSWNSMRYLPDALATIAQQTVQDTQIIMVDNASTDGVESFVREQYPAIVFVRNFQNTGFAHAHNQAITMAMALWDKQQVPMDERYVLVTNPDILLAPTYLASLLPAIQQQPTMGSFGGLLHKVVSTPKEDGGFSPVQSTRIDTTGLKLTKYLRVVERGAGEEDHGQYAIEEEVFGVSGALGLYRMSALRAVAYHHEYFDEQFFAYKEDVDMAWRLQKNGFGSWYVPSARAYHYRAASGSEHRSLLTSWRERRAKSSLVNRLSYRNHVWLLLKHLTVVDWLRFGVLVFPYECGKWLYSLCCEPRTLFRAMRECIAGAGNILAKKKALRALPTYQSRTWWRWVA